MTTIEDRLIRVSSRVNDVYNSFFGTFQILPEQFIHLNGYIVIIDKDFIKLIKQTGIEDQIHSYSINTSKLRYHNSELLLSMIITIDNLNKFNVDNGDPVHDLLENVLYFRPPTTIYITYHPIQDIYTVKNLNMATMFIMKKVSDNQTV